jgi:acyl-CoA thioesterase I
MPKIFQLIVPIILVMSCNQHKPNQSVAVPATSTPNNATTPPTDNKKIILFFGNSLTAGYGLPSMDQAFPALIGRRIDSLHLPYRIINAGVSGETSAGGKSRIGWVLRQPVAIFVLELGANDGLRGIPLAGTRANLQAILDSVKARYPDAKLVVAGMRMPPSMGADYATRFRNIFPDLAKTNDAALIPFLLQDVGGVPHLNQPDGIHPAVQGHRIVAENVWRVLAPLLSKERS